ncbi:MAG TPA: molybdopterin cofactor-binding domain-containing protein [Terriglobales bacterium]|nr:molybdopterin cofactor-binding domain-containing protein [Terriglobales bacterium]
MRKNGNTEITDKDADLLEAREHAAIHRMAYGFDLGRREFFKLLGGGVLVCACAGRALGQESGETRRTPENSEQNLPRAIDAWLHVGEDGVVTVYTGKAEMGQNIRTSLSQQVAEELRVPLASVRLVMADTAETPFDMGTFGSRTTPQMGTQLRKVAASARDVLTQMAAAQWGVDAGKLVAAEGKISDPAAKRSVSYAELSKGKQLVKVIEDEPPVTPAEKWQVAGTAIPKVDGRDFVTGRHKYTSDMMRTGMLYGKILRPSAFKATLATLDASAAEKMPGVKVVRDGNFVGVAAADQYTATRAISAMRAQWNAPQQVKESELFEHLKKSASEKHPGDQWGPSLYEVGSVKEALTKAEKTLEQSYTIVYIAHVPLEPRAALAEWKDGKLTVWTGTQRPFAVRDELAQAFRLSSEQVRVIVPDTGSAYGGKHTGETAVEAARLAKAAGKPVKLVWTREEEFTWAYFRPAGVIDVKSGMRPDGTLVAWQFDNYNSGPAAIRTPYNVANQRIEYHPADTPLRQGSYRGLAAPANFFARESHMDELAHLLEMDPLEFRLKNLSDARLRAVFEAVAKKFGWGREKSSPIRGFGIAGGVEKGGYVATCAEVEIGSGGEVKVRRVAEAFECGAVVNPNGLQNQISGAIVQGLGGALFEAIHFDNGRILNPHLASYRVPRFSDVPQIEIEILDRKDLPSAGAGETPIMALAPAVANAIFAATGIRLRALPLVPEGLPAKG